MEILKRYYQYQGLVDKIKELETINLRLHGELEELAKARLDDIKSWNAAFDIERKNLLDKQYALEQQLLRVCGLISTEDQVVNDTNPVKDGTKLKQSQTADLYRPGKRSLSKDEQDELKQLRLANVTEDELMATWMRAQGVMDDYLDDPEDFDPDVSFKGR